METYFPIDEHRMIINEPFQATENAEKFDVRVNVQGGGTAGQVEAIRLGISRALLLHDAELRAASRPKASLPAIRVRERKKPG